MGWKDWQAWLKVGLIGIILLIPSVIIFNIAISPYVGSIPSEALGAAFFIQYLIKLSLFFALAYSLLLSLICLISAYIHYRKKIFIIFLIINAFLLFIAIINLTNNLGLTCHGPDFQTQKLMCYESAALILRDVSLCDSIEYTRTRAIPFDEGVEQTRDACRINTLTSIAVKKGDFDGCEAIPGQLSPEKYPSAFNESFRASGFETNETKRPAKIIISCKIKLLKNLAVENGDMGYCSNIMDLPPYLDFMQDNSPYVKECALGLFEQTNQKAGECNRLDDCFLKRECYFSFIEAANRKQIKKDWRQVICNDLKAGGCGLTESIFAEPCE